MAYIDTTVRRENFHESLDSSLRLPPMPKTWDTEQQIDVTPEEAKQAVKTLIAFTGDVDREGLRETPDRVVRAFSAWFDGYGKNPAEILKCFVDGAEHTGPREMVVQTDIPFYSHCEHHIAPFFGVVHIGYIPSSKILGLSKFKRLVDCFAHRLQVQERMTSQICDALRENLTPTGVAVVVEGRHMCMESRGVSVQGAVTKTIALRGAFDLQLSTREEFLAHLARK